MGQTELKFDEIGRWSEIKLEIIKEYATAYSTILAAQKGLSHVYIDAFSGPGVHISKVTGKFIPGSPTNALNVQPPFKEYFFIDLDKKKLSELAEQAKKHSNVHIFEGNCNEILLSKVFPKVRYADYRRGLCLLDPYGLHLKWDVIYKAGQEKSLELFLNFPVMDMNQNVLWHNPQGTAPVHIQRMNDFWGDESWRKIAFSPDLFGQDIKVSDNRTIASAFQDRLIKVAGFAHVPEPMPMRNSKGAIVYYLFFASPNKTGNKIIKDIFEKYGGEEYQWR
ncbi:MAG: three-Cys-motif partner protein TcmP [Elusimicrobia bacterium]|nr:three-Cys-motif partner protein TcmP [Elusimicrobiota bacterium]